MRRTLSITILLATAVSAADTTAQVRPRGSLDSFRTDAQLHDYLRQVVASQPRTSGPVCPESVAASVIRRARAAGADATVTGTVRSDEGPLAGAQVSVRPAGPGTLTSPAGSFTLDIPHSAIADTGAVTIHAALIGYTSAQLPLSLQPGDSAVVELRLCVSPVMLESALVAGAELSVTNVQHDGVDEGGIVKLHGNHLVVLRRGRLFTIDIRGGRLDPVATVDAFAPGIRPEWDWYDELLISGNDVIVIGYSYARGGTEVNLFRIDRDGRLHYRSTYHLRSNDYYSARNYASRLVDGRLIFYTPLSLGSDAPDVTELLPALRRWRGDEAGEFRSMTTATRVYRPARNLAPGRVRALHTVTTCDIANGELDCTATALLGPFAHTFYVSQGSVWLWLADDGGAASRGMLYRMPLDGRAPTALGVSGSPLDQFSFLEDGSQLNVLVSPDAYGQWMWRGERPIGGLALLRIPISRLGDGRADAPSSAYLPLPGVSGYALQNRFVGGHLVYGTGAGWGRGSTRTASAAHVVNVRTGSVASFSLRHGVDRIERLGAGALIVGADEEDLHFTSIRLGRRPVLADTHVLRGASQGDLRSHGFFYRADGPARGLLGLPIARPGRPGFYHLFENAAAVAFLATDDLRFSERGLLEAQPGTSHDDACRVSCADWYGNARPLFVGGRIFALLGYEIVEGRVRQDGMQEVRRAYFGPTAPTAAR